MTQDVKPTIFLQETYVNDAGATIHVRNDVRDGRRRSFHATGVMQRPVGRNQVQMRQFPVQIEAATIEEAFEKLQSAVDAEANRLIREEQTKILLPG